MTKYKWNLPNNKGRSIRCVEWPEARYSASGSVCAYIVCHQDYSHKVAKSGDHQPLNIRIIDYSRNITHFYNKAAKTLTEAKKFVRNIIRENPHFEPSNDNNTKFKIGDIWESRNGERYAITEFRNGQRYCVVARRLGENLHRVFTRSGEFLAFGISEIDLVKHIPKGEKAKYKSVTK